MTTICAYPVQTKAEYSSVAKPNTTTPAHICKELADGFWKGTSYCVEHLELVALGKG